MPPFQMKLLTTKENRGIETFDEEAWIASLRGVKKLQVVSCFFDVKWLQKVRDKLSKEAQLEVHLNRPPRGSRTWDDLSRFLKEARERGPTEVLLHTASTGLFHSKLYVLWRPGRSDEPDETTTYIGSSNATAPAFGRNEEILMEIVGVNTPAGVESYLKSLQETGEPLGAEPRTLSLEQFLREAQFAFRPTRSDPFRLLLATVQEAPDAPARARGLTYSDRKAAFSLWKAVDLAAGNDDTDETLPDNSALRLRLRSRAIETSYGFWIPTPYFSELEPHIEQALKDRVERLHTLRELLAEREQQVRNQFERALAEVNRARSKPFSADEERQRHTAFERLLELSYKRLDDDHWVAAYSRRFYSATVPDIFSDPESRQEFLDSFFFDLEQRISDPSPKQPRIIKSFKEGFERWAGPELLKRKSAFHKPQWFEEAMEAMLSAEDFTPEQLWGISEDDDD